MMVRGLRFRVGEISKDWLPFLTFFGLKNGLNSAETWHQSRSKMAFERLVCYKRGRRLPQARASLDFNGHPVCRKRQGKGWKIPCQHS
jgi:hypothetical protein